MTKGFKPQAKPAQGIVVLTDPFSNARFTEGIQREKRINIERGKMCTVTLNLGDFFMGLAVTLCLFLNGHCYI